MFRKERPSSKIVTIAGFSIIKGRHEPYESSVFESAGYKWRLILYVTGNQKYGVNDYISLYVRIEDTMSLPKGWEVNVDFKLCVDNKKKQKYLTLTDGKVKKFSEAQKEWGFTKFILLSAFCNTNEGYIVHDTCSFGVEIFVINPAQKQEKVTFISNPPITDECIREVIEVPRNNSRFTWKITQFSSFNGKHHSSHDFTVGPRKWKLVMYPRGDGIGEGNSLSFCLNASDYVTNGPKTKTLVVYKLRVLDQLKRNHYEIKDEHWFLDDSTAGQPMLLPLEELHKASRGFLVEDEIYLGVEFLRLSTNLSISDSH